MATMSFGKYRGVVIDNLDPLELGRLRVQVPNVLMPDPTPWAMPCVPYAGPGVGWYVLPPIGASIWVEFEGGDPILPIWSGCFWTNKGQVPAKPAVPTMRMLKTSSGTLAFNDLDGEGGFTLTVGDPAVAARVSIEANSDGLTIAFNETQIVLRDTGVTVTAQPGTAEIKPEGITLTHGSATVLIREPQISVNGTVLQVVGDVRVNGKVI